MQQLPCGSTYAKPQEYVKKTESTANEVEQQLQQSEKRRCGAEEELKLIAGDCENPRNTIRADARAGEVVLMRTRAAEIAGNENLCASEFLHCFTCCSGIGNKNTSVCDRA
jgi:hypothetical protein